MNSDTAEQVIVLTPVRAAGRGGRIRLRGLILAAVSLKVMLLASSLRPYASGLGTHQQLGLPACSFEARTGLPCPSCGMTTSMAAMAHGQVGAALSAHPFGVVAFLAVLALAGVGMVELATGFDVLARARPRLWWVWVGLAILFGGWLWKLARLWGALGEP